MSRQRRTPQSITHCPGCYEKLYYDADAQDPDTVIEDHTSIRCTRPNHIVLARVRGQFGPPPSNAPAGKPRKGHETNHA